MEDGQKVDLVQDAGWKMDRRSISCRMQDGWNKYRRVCEGALWVQ